MIIASKDKTQKSSDVLGAWRQSISFRGAGYNPARVQPVSNNKIRVEFDNEKQRDDVLKRTMAADGFEAEVGKRRRPLMIIKGINKMTTKEDVIQIIIESNPSIKDAAEPVAGSSNAPPPDAPVRMCFARKNWSDRLYNLVIEVSPKVRHALLNLGRVNIDHQRVHVADFSAFVQCYHCLQFGHTRSKCPDADTENFHRCSHCASTEHDFKNCPDYKDKKKMRCYNCHLHNTRTQDSVNDAHSATSSKHCPRVKAVLTRINERVQYD